MLPKNVSKHNLCFKILRGVDFWSRHHQEEIGTILLQGFIVCLICELFDESRFQIPTLLSYCLVWLSVNVTIWPLFLWKSQYPTSHCTDQSGSKSSKSQAEAATLLSCDREWDVASRRPTDNRRKVRLSQRGRNGSIYESPTNCREIRQPFLRQPHSNGGLNLTCSHCWETFSLNRGNWCYFL